MTNTAWVSELFESGRAEHRALMTDKEYALEMRRRWLALAPDFFYYVTLTDMRAAVDEFNRAAAGVNGRSRMTVEARRTVNEVVFTFDHLIFAVQLMQDKETILCHGDEFPERAYKVVLLSDHTFVLREHAFSTNIENIGRGAEARVILRPFFDKARQLLSLI